MVEIDFQITHDGRVFHYTYSGELEWQKVDAINVERYNDPRLEKAQAYIQDYSGLSPGNVTPTTIKNSAKRFVQLREEHNDTRPSVWVAPKDVQFGLARMRQMVEDGANENMENYIFVVRTLEEAKRWVEEHLDSQRSP